jgi:hypothetical protein
MIDADTLYRWRATLEEARGKLTESGAIVSCRGEKHTQSGIADLLSEAETLFDLLDRELLEAYLNAIR